MFNGLGMGLNNLYRLANAKSRSISAENFTGEKGGGACAEEGTGKICATDLGKGWKVSPSVVLKAKSEFVAANIQTSGALQHLWMTLPPDKWRKTILKIYWDGEKEPSVLVPIGDFFCMGWCERGLVNSLPIVVGPAGGFNCYFEMPFKKSAKIVIENISDTDTIFYYQVDFIETEIEEEVGYFHASFRRKNPNTKKAEFTLLDNVKGKGNYVGTYLAWQVNNNGWWGEGEMKFYIDGDKEYPTICGTGTEDYFGGAWNFEYPAGQYCSYSTPYLGLPQIIRPDGLYRANMRFGLYRFHIQDTIRFESDLKVTIQDLGWRNVGVRYLAQQSDIAATTYWYQTEPHNKFAQLKDEEYLEVI